MNFFKKSFLYLIFILLLTSIYHDLSSGSLTTVQDEKKIHTTIKINSVKIQALPGQSLLSIVENYSTSESLDIEQIINDFKKLNPSTDPYFLEAYEYYSIPVYTETGG